METTANQIQRTLPMLTFMCKTCRETQTAAWSENVEAITGVCSGKERGDVQSLSTRDPNVEEMIFMCVLWGTLFLWKVTALMASDNLGREAVVTREVVIPPESFCPSYRTSGNRSSVSGRGVSTANSGALNDRFIHYYIYRTLQESALMG